MRRGRVLTSCDVMSAGPVEPPLVRRRRLSCALLRCVRWEAGARFRRGSWIRAVVGVRPYIMCAAAMCLCGAGPRSAPRCRTDAVQSGAVATRCELGCPTHAHKPPSAPPALICAAQLSLFTLRHSALAYNTIRYIPPFSERLYRQATRHAVRQERSQATRDMAYVITASVASA